MNSLDGYKMTYERYKETKTDLTHIHKYSRDFWVAACDFIYNASNKLSRAFGHKTTRASKKRS